MQPIPSHWTIEPGDVESLEAALWPDSENENATLTDADAQALASIPSNYTFTVYAHVAPLDPCDPSRAAGGTLVDWTGERAWFDEMIKIGRKRVVDDCWWTGTNDGNEDEEELLDSYIPYNGVCWDDRQQERDPSLTLPSGAAELLDAHISRIDSILDNGSV